MSGIKGKILSHTTIRASPEGFEAPYIVGIVQLDNGEKLVGEICIDMDSTTSSLINQTVNIVFRKIQIQPNGLRVYGYKFLMK
ncbi:MAG: OB-fold domain-containing protein [Candidatus Aenigmatarchaeota archaeon]